MRILLFSGKGGVGKTSLAAATGLHLSRLGYRTMVMSVDPAHSLADAFDLETSLFQNKTNDPFPIDDRLAIHEVNIQKEIKRIVGLVLKKAGFEIEGVGQAVRGIDAHHQ